MNHWVVHLDELRYNPDLINIVENKGLIGVGWPDIDDLNKYKTREDFQKIFHEKYPEETRKMSISIQVGMLYRWAHEVKKGDIAIVPLKINDTIKVGKFSEDTSFLDVSFHPDYPHVRKVEWIKDVKRSDFTQDALYSIGSALTLSQPSEDVEKQLDLILNGKKVPGVSQTISKDIIEGGQLFLLEKHLKNQLDEYITQKINERKGYSYQDIVGGVLQTMGYHIEIHQPGPDGKKDIMAYSDRLGLKDPIIRVEVKSQDSPVSSDDVSSLAGYIKPNEKGLFVSRMGFTKPAILFAEEKGITLMTGEEIIELLLEKYSELPDKIKDWIPLKKIWIPDIDANTTQ
ncbi:MAG: restriction endonuclease [Candidatus Thermoplasmatota archaeon]|nr:restriction endonuclease [Candidatus Thermoplasmatota archaeon]